MWWWDAACTGRPELFFGPDGENRHAHERREAAAKAVCAGCPVRRPCAAAGARERFGVWSGAGEAERRAGRRTAARLAAVAAPTDETKYCPHCDEDRPVGAFGKAAGRADGLTPWCREHTNAYQRGRRVARAAAPATGPEVALMNGLRWA